MTGNPFADRAHEYRKAGWYPIPLGQRGQRNAKAPVPAGVTGARGRLPTEQDIDGWIETHAANNIGVRLPKTIIALDTDQYDKTNADTGVVTRKRGAEQLAAVVDDLGLVPLPRSPKSSARGPDNPSRIEFYTVPDDGREYHESVPGAPDVDVIQFGHRYSAVAGSIHPETGEPYVWYRSDGKTPMVGIPKVSSLNALPEGWLDLITKNRDGKSAGAFAEVDDQTATEWIRVHGSGEPCRAVRGVLKSYREQITDETDRTESHYGLAVHGSWALIELAVEGHRGARPALKVLRDAYEEYASGQTKRDPTEWKRAVTTGIAKAIEDNDESLWSQHGPAPADCPDRPGNEKADNEWPSPSHPLEVAEEYVARCWQVDGQTTLKRWRGEWWHWSGTHYVTVSEETIHVALYGLLRDALCWGAGEQPTLLSWKPDDAKLRKVTRALAGVPHVFVADDFEPVDDGSTIELANGYLDVATRSLKPHTPTRFTIASLPFDYGADAVCASWERYLDGVWPTDHGEVLLLQQWFGYVVSMSTGQQRLMVLLGQPRTGKGTIARVLQSVLGPANCCAPTLSRMSGVFGLQPLIGKSLAVIGDAQADSRVAAGSIEELKSITGEDTINVPRKGITDWSGKLGVRFLMATNRIPSFMDSSGALAQRLLVLSFDQSFAGQEDGSVEERLMAELPGILNWSLDGLDSLLEAGKFTAPDDASASQRARRHMSEQFSPIKEFLNEYAKPDPDGEVEKSALFGFYRSWCNENGRRPLASNQFSADLQSIVPGVLGNNNPVRRDGQRVMLYYGIRMRE